MKAFLAIAVMYVLGALAVVIVMGGLPGRAPAACYEGVGLTPDGRSAIILNRCTGQVIEVGIGDSVHRIAVAEAVEVA